MTSLRRASVTALFALLVFLAFSDEFLSAAMDVWNVKRQVGTLEPDRFDWLVVWIDGTILTAVLIPIAWSRRRSSALWFLASAAVGATLTLGTDIADLYFDAGRAPQWLAELVPGWFAGRASWAPLVPSPSTPLGRPHWWIDMCLSLSWVMGLAILVAAVLGTSPRLLVWPRLRSRRPQEWVRLRAAVPLLVGTLGAYLGTVWWEYALNLPYEDAAQGADKEFYAQLSQVIALLIVALGLEVGYFRDRTTVVSLSILCLGEVMALSALAIPKNITPWHAYLAFIICVEACLIALSTMILVLVTRKERDRVRPTVVRRQRRRLVPATSKIPLPRRRALKQPQRLSASR